MRRTWIGMIAMAAILTTTAGCRTAMTAGAVYDPAVPFGEWASFAWDEPDGLPTGDPRLDNNPFFLARLHGAIERQLGLRGIRLRGNSPALLIHHHATVRDRVEVLMRDRDAGYTTSPYGPGTEIYQYDEGTFLIDVAEAATMRIVWRGWVKADLAGALHDPKALAELVDEAVAAMFERFPLPVGSTPVEPPVVEPVPPVDGSARPGDSVAPVGPS